MSSIRLKHASGNSMSLAAPGTNPASNLELKLPHTIGSANQLLKVDGNGQLGWADDNSGLSISNNADNRIVTGTGSALNAEAYLLWDGQTLTANGTSNDTPLILDTTNSNGAHMRFRTNGGTQHFLGCGGGISLGDSQDLSMRAYDNLLFATGNSSTERFRITSDGKIGIGTASPDSLLHLKKSSGAKVTIESDDNNDAWINFSGASNEMSVGFDKTINSLIVSNSDSIQANQRGVITSAGKVGIGTTSPDVKLHVHKGSAGSASSDNNAVVTIENSNHSILQMLSPAANSCRIMFGDPDSINSGELNYDHNINAMMIKTADSERLRIDSSGRLLVGVTSPSTSSSERFEVSGMSLFMNNSSSTGTVYIRNQASDAGTGHVLVFQDGSANRGGITLDNNDQVTHTGHQGVLFKTGGTLGGGYERARFPNGGGLQLKNTGANKGIIWNRTGSENATTFANVQGSGGRGIIETQINNIPSSTTTDLAKSHWGGLCLIGWANSSGTSTNYQGHEQVMFGYNGTPSSRYKRQFAGNLTITYTMSAYTLRVNHNGSVNIDFWCILIGV